jgi:hypothetical protein
MTKEGRQIKTKTKTPNRALSFSLLLLARTVVVYFRSHARSSSTSARTLGVVVEVKCQSVRLRTRQKHLAVND